MDWIINHKNTKQKHHTQKKATANYTANANRIILNTKQNNKKVAASASFSIVGAITQQNITKQKKNTVNKFFVFPI